MTLPSAISTSRAARIHLRGCVQGRGVRPAIHQLARQCGLVGQVSNSLRGVDIIVEGNSSDVESFASRLPNCLPDGLQIDEVHRQEIAVQQFAEFSIVHEPSNGSLATSIPADIGICTSCLAEVADENNRRFGYALNSCVACGPRYVSIRVMPYERPNTTMRSFPFCAACLAEYDSPLDQRFHAETSSCPDCGPQVWLVDVDGEQIRTTPEVIDRAVWSLRQGKIVALRGVGGYQLLVDAGDEDAVSRLRHRKKRRGKPLAVMVADMNEAERIATLDPDEMGSLADPSNPIVLCSARGDSPLAESVHPGLRRVGLMLPTTALHWMLMRKLNRPIVCTSGNREGDPLDMTPQQAEENLSGIADLWVHHSRPIERPMDDSVVQLAAGRMTTLRLARGMAPLTLDVSLSKPTLAVGGFLKSAIAWSGGNQSVLGPHLGDHRTDAVRRRFVEQIDDAQKLYRFRAEQVVHDDHPDYFSTRWARNSKLTCSSTQHHHAHVVAGMLEHGWLDRTVMGVAWDGTGYGTDGTIWGGEFLLSRAGSFRRVGHLRPFCLPGGEIAVSQPWRTAMAILVDAGIDDMPPDWLAPGTDAGLKSSVHQILRRPHLSPMTTSAGRLFDAAAAMVLPWEIADFEGQGPLMLEAIADRSAPGSYSFPLNQGDPFQMDWRPLFAQLWTDRRSGTSASTLAMRFHRSVAEGIAASCRCRSESPVVLCGGVFQNRLLVELLTETMNDCRPLGLPGLIPTGDGGLAAGQLAIAAARESERCV